MPELFLKNPLIKILHQGRQTVGFQILYPSLIQLHEGGEGYEKQFPEILHPVVIQALLMLHLIRVYLHMMIVWVIIVLVRMY